MTVLSDAFEARYSAQRIVEWTNPGVPAATTKDSTRLLAACTDAEADVKTFTRTVFDSTNAAGLLAQQLPVALHGVRAYLLSWLDQGAGDAAIAEFHRRLRELEKVTGGDRVLPTTSSNLVPSAVPRTPGATARPDFDDSIFDNSRLSPPSQTGGGGSIDNWDDE